MPRHVDSDSRTRRALRPFLALLLTLLASGCATTAIPKSTFTSSDPEAFALVTASQRSHGAASFATIRDLNVRYVGKWSWLGARMRPAPSDHRFRRESEEALDLTTGTTVQLHKGGGGRKFVLRAPGHVTVSYNGQVDTREEVIRAAALEVDVGKMLLLGPHYFQRPGVVLEKLGPTKVNGAECDQVLAVLRPGFGYAEEDRVVLSIDQKTQRLRRVAMTLEGLRKEKGAEMEVTFDNWGERSGVWWATEYDERLRGGLGFGTHHWRLLELKANRGFAPQHPELIGEALTEAAVRMH